MRFVRDVSALLENSLIGAVHCDTVLVENRVFNSLSLALRIGTTSKPCRVVVLINRNYPFVFSDGGNPHIIRFSDPIPDNPCIVRDGVLRGTLCACAQNAVVGNLSEWSPARGLRTILVDLMRVLMYPKDVIAWYERSCTRGCMHSHTYAAHSNAHLLCIQPDLVCVSLGW